MTPELAKWLIASIASATVVIVGAVVWLTVLTFRIGQKYGRVETALEKVEALTSKLEEVHERLERVAVVETKIAQLIDSHAEERRRFASEWPVLRSKVDVLWDKVMSLKEWRRSTGQFGQ